MAALCGPGNGRQSNIVQKCMGVALCPVVTIIIALAIIFSLGDMIGGTIGGVIALGLVGYCIYRCYQSHKNKNQNVNETDSASRRRRTQSD